MGPVFDIKREGNDDKSLTKLLDATHAGPGIYDKAAIGYKSPYYQPEWTKPKPDAKPEEK